MRGAALLRPAQGVTSAPPVSASSQRHEGATYIAARLWIWLSAWLSATGWLLSWFTQLGRPGYAFGIGVGLVGLSLWLMRDALWRTVLRSLRRLRRLPRTSFHGLFIIVWVLASTG